MNVMTMPRSLAAVACALLALAGCSSLPDQVAELEAAKTEVNTLESHPLAQQAADDELDQAREFLDEAQAAYDDEKDLALIEHKAYIAKRYAQIGQELVAQAALQQQINQAEARRSQVLLQAREQELVQARERVSSAEQRAQQREQQARDMAAAAAAASLEAERLQQELSDMQAKNTERGVVLTLGEVLFDFDEATLRRGAESTINELAQFLKERPERNLIIEGHTDAVGSEQYNQQLSERRAKAVREALVQRGIDGQRIQTVGLGEAFPVASNDSQAGRLENRRIEIVISNDSGEFPATAQRN